MINNRRDAIFQSFTNILNVANTMGRYFVDSLANTLESRLVAWKKELFGVKSTDEAVIVVIPANGKGKIDDVLIRLNTASQNHYLKWLPLEKQWGLVNMNRERDSVSWDVITANPIDVAGNVIGGMLATDEAREYGDAAAHNLMTVPDVDPAICFLCNQRPATTDEHVFPKWLQRDFNLWNERVGLLNLTKFRYRSLTVPACKRCNSVYLKDIEDRVCNSVREGYHIAKHLDDVTIFQWLGKILLGLLVKQTQLKLDQRNPDDESKILPSHLFKGINTLRKWLSSVYRPVKFEKPLPWVVYILNVQEDLISFHYRDSISELTFMIQLGDVGILMVAMDHLVRADEGSGPFSQFDRLTNISYGRLIREQIEDHPIHTLQFIELYCRITHQHSLATIPPAFRFGTDLTDPRSNRLEVGNTAVPFEMEEWNEDAVMHCVRVTAESVGFHLESDRSWLLDQKSNFVKFTDEEVTKAV